MIGKEEQAICNTKDTPDYDEPSIKGKELTQVLMQMFKINQGKEVKNDQVLQDFSHRDIVPKRNRKEDSKSSSQKEFTFLDH